MYPASYRFSLTIAALAGSVVLAGAIAAHAARPAGNASLTLVAFSTPKDAYDALIPAFSKTPAGKSVSFTTSYGASGDQSRLVANGLQADIVAFSLEPDVNRLVKVGLVPATWYQNRYHGFITDSVVVFAVRKGNPKHIKTWNDLIKPGIQVITPNPFTSGGARWNVMAAYGAQLAQKRTGKQAVAYLTKLFANVAVQDKSARDALNTFDSGKGDVMLAYENEVIAARQKGEKIDYLIPEETILIENPIAVTKISKHLKESSAFVRFLYTPAAQKIFGQKGYRPVVTSVLKTFHYKQPKKLFTIRSLGSWPTVQTKFFDPQNGIMATIERDRGVSP